MERVALPLAQGLVGLERVVEDGLRAVLGLDDDVRLGERALDVAALAAPWLLVGEEPAPDGVVRIEHDLELLPLDLDRLDRRARLAEGVRRDGGDGRAREPRLLLEPGRLARPDRGPHARQRERGREVDSPHLRMRVGRAEHGRVQHPGQLEVGGIARLAAHPLVAVLARRGPADHRERPLGPLLEWILLDDDPHLLEASLDLFLGADQSCHERIASSILGYVPQRQMFPAIACRISSRVGCGFAATSAAAETTWPGVQ